MMWFLIYFEYQNISEDSSRHWGNMDNLQLSQLRCLAHAFSGFFFSYSISTISLAHFSNSCYFLKLDLWTSQSFHFFIFSCMFLNPNSSFPILILIVLIYHNFRNKLKKHSVTKICSELSLFEWIVLFSDLKNFENSRPSASNFKRSEQLLVTECFFNLFQEVSHI